jgi:hypothetical protein
LMSRQESGALGQGQPSGQPMVPHQLAEPRRFPPAMPPRQIRAFRPAFVITMHDCTPAPSSM